MTVVQSDLKGSTALGEKLDPESLREVMTRYIDEMRAVFEGHGGTIEKIIGDAIIAVFGMPVRRDDDALRALEAAADSQRALVTLNDLLEATWGVRLVVRTGVATGEVVVGSVTASQHVLTGEAMRVAGAMEQSAPAAEVRVADSTRRLVGDRVAFEQLDAVVPKGSDDAIESWRLVSVLAPTTRSDDDVLHGRLICSNCGQENPGEAKFCGTCASPLSAPRARESRKTVTIVFADPKPSSIDGSPPDPEAIRDVMSRYFDEMKVALERHGGTVEKFIGDAVMAVFGLPVRHEDDAVRAARAALDMQAALPPLNEDFERTWGIRLGNHIGVNTGEVIAGDATLGQRLVTGDAVNVAARLEQSAHAGEVIVGDLTYRLARDFAEVDPIAPLTLKGKSEPVPAYRLLTVHATAERQSSGAPFVGREDEMARLATGLDEAVARQAARMLTVVGDAGVGKSRLIKEFADRAGERAAVLRGRCLPYGDGITFWPFAEIVREAAAIGSEDTPEIGMNKMRALLGGQTDGGEHERIVERVAAVIGLSAAQFPLTELFWGARKFIEAIGRRRPLVMIVDDIHSAEQTFLDLLDHFEEAIDRSPVLVLCSARREIQERHPDWTEAHTPALIVLEPLSDADAGQIVEKILGGAGLDPDVVGKITAAAEGNPLFVEQMVSMLIDNGTLRNEDGRWIASAASEIAVPPSITALLAARLDSLPQDERVVLEPASVIGLSFPVPALEELLDESIRPSLLPALQSVERKQFVRATTLDEDEAYRFAHILVKDTAYGSLLKRLRAGYHERFVDWAERVNAERGRGLEFEEIHGYHLEQAYRYLTELGVLDDAARAVGQRASLKLASAGRRALARGDIPAAANLLRRATETRERLDPERLEIIPDLGLALMELGEFADAATRLDEARSLALEAGADIVECRAALARCYVRIYSGEGEDSSLIAAREVERTLPILEAVGDEQGQTLAWRLRLILHARAGRWGDLAVASREVIAHARATGDVRTETRASIAYADAATYGPTPVAEAIAECEVLLESTAADQIANAKVRLALAQLCARADDIDRARSLYRGVRERLLDGRAGIAAATTSLASSTVEMLAGDPVAAERELRLDHDALASIDERYLLPTIDALLARALLEQGRIDDAAVVAGAVREVAGEDDTDPQAGWRSVMARVAVVRGDLGTAVALAQDAVALRREAQSPDELVDALIDLATALRAAGRSDEAAGAIHEGLALAIEKGDVVTRRQLEALEAR